MKVNTSRMWRSGIAMLLALCLVVGFFPVAAFAAEVKDTNDDGVINYVSLGASNVNGYGMHGYMPSEDIYEHPLLKETANIYGYKQDTPGSYPVLIKEYLEEQGNTVNLSQMAISSMRAEEVRFLLDDSYLGDAYTDWRFYDVPGVERYNDDGSVKSSHNWFYNAGMLEWEARGNSGTPTQEQAVAVLKDAYREAVADADLITVDIGINNFGVYASNQIVNKLYSNDLNTIDPELAAYYAEGKAYAMELIKDNMGAAMSIMPIESLEYMADTMAYALVGFCLSFDAVIEQIKTLNPDATIVVVSIQNLMYGLDAILPGMDEALPYGDMFGALINAANVYTATISPYSDSYIYADVRQNGHVEFFSDELLTYNGDPSTLSRDMKDCFDVYDNDLYIKTRVQQLLAKQLYAAGLLDVTAAIAAGATNIADNLEHFALAYQYDLLTIPALDSITLEEFFAAGAEGSLPAVAQPYYDGYVVALSTAHDVMAEIMKAGLEIDTLDATSFGKKFGPVEDALLGAFFGTLEDAVGKSIADPTFQFRLEDYYPDGIYKTLAAAADVPEGFVNTVAIMGIRTSIGNSFFGHPNGNGQIELKNKILAAIEEDITGEDVVINELKIALEDLVAIIKEYGPDAAEAVWARWVEMGYVAEVEAYIDELIDTVEVRYEYYANVALPAIEDAILALNGEKDVLVAELDELNAQLAAKKAELEAAIAAIEVSGVYTPEINIDPIGGNKQTEVADNECVVEGEGVIAELEAAIRDIEHAIAVVEALIADVDADLADMAKLAAQIADAVKELNKSYNSIVAAAKDLYAAFKAIEEALTGDADQTIEAVTSAFEAARSTAVAALDALEVAMGYARELDADIIAEADKLVAMVEALYNKFVTEDSLEAYIAAVMGVLPEEYQNTVMVTALLLQEFAPEAVAYAEEVLTAKVEELKAECEKEIEALIEEYKPEIEKAEKELEAKWEEIKPQIEAKYEELKAEAEAEYEAAVAALEAKQAELVAELIAAEAELKATMEEMKGEAADKIEAAVAPLKAQIARLEKDLATVTADLACAAGHLENALKLAYEEAKIAVMALYNETMAKLNAAIEALKAQLKKDIEALKAEIEKQIKDAVNEAMAALLAEVKKTVEDLKNALVAMGIETVEELVDALTALFNELLYNATHADLVIDENFKYVAMGDGSVEGYAEALNAYLAAEAAKEGIDSIAFVNAAVAGNSVAAAAADLPADIADADLITLGFSQTDMLANAITAEELDWAALVGEEAVPYVEKALAKVEAEINALDLPNEEIKAMLCSIVEAYAYNVVEYAINLPALIYAIREVNADAVIVVVGMYNPIDGVTALGNDLSAFAEYFDYLIEAADAYGIGLAMLSNAMDYVVAPEVAVEKAELNALDLAVLVAGDASALYPSAEGEAYIAEKIEEALTLSFEVAGLWGDADGDGVVTPIDAMLVLQFYVGSIEATELNVKVSDVDGDAEVSPIDAMLILQYYVGDIAKFPVEG